ncbi:MAG: GNAT family N-acetyltransferase [Proteobacteria bacterium]|nr:GNAT family N-acetyltransferase [Pseudomonadota bacterium]
MNVHKARVEDEGRVIELLTQFPSSGIEHADWTKGGSTFRLIVSQPDLGTILLAEEDGEALGLITLSYPTAIRCGGIYTCIEEFIVGEKGRGKGIGGSLLRAALDEARRRGCFELQVNNPSELGYPVYLKYGLSDDGRHLKIVFDSK